MKTQSNLTILDKRSKASDSKYANDIPCFTFFTATLNQEGEGLYYKSYNVILRMDCNPGLGRPSQLTMDNHRFKNYRLVKVTMEISELEN